MIKTQVNHVVEYLSSTLILSYFFMHNIILVLIGIAFSLYLINSNSINRFIKSIDKSLFIQKDSIVLYEHDIEVKTEPIEAKTTKEYKELALVETIEELGFIPSLDENDEINAA